MNANFCFKQYSVSFFIRWVLFGDAEEQKRLVNSIQDFSYHCEFLSSNKLWLTIEPHLLNVIKLELKINLKL